MKLLILLILIILCPSAYAQIQNQDATAIEGTLVQLSKLPVAASNPYPDCYYTAVVEVDHIVSGKSIPKKVILVLPGFFSRQYAPEANFKTGDKVRATLVPFASTPDKLRQTQQADDIEDVDLEFYFPTKIAPVQQFKKSSRSVPFAGKAAKVRGLGVSQPVDEKAEAARREVMQHDLEQINRLLAEHGGDWDKWYQSLKDFMDKYKQQFQAKSGKWINDSFFSAGQVADDKPYAPDFVQSIIAFKRYLAARNVDLIIARFPYKGEIVDDLFAPIQSDQVTNPYLLRMYKELLEADVEIITNIIPRAKKERLKYPLMYWYQNFDESHPAEGMAWTMAEAIAERLSRYEKIRTVSPGKLRLETRSRSDIKFLWPEGHDMFNASEDVTFKTVLSANGKAINPTQGTESAVLVVGSSFIGRPSLEGASVPSYIAYLTGIIPDIVYRSGSDASIPRSIARLGDTFLKNRIVCIFPFPPWVPYSGLSAPPIADPDGLTKVLLSTYAANNMQKSIQLIEQRGILAFGPDGSVIAKSDKASPDGRLRLALPEEIANFPFFQIDIMSSAGDTAAFKATYATQTDSVYKSYAQSSSEESLIFKTSASRFAEINIHVNKDDLPTTIHTIKIHGLKSAVLK